MSKLTQIKVVDTEQNSPFLQEIREIRKNKRFCDIKIVVGDSEIDAHKVVLSACSPFFSRHFKDFPANEIDLSEIHSFSVVSAIIDYMYSGSILFLFEDASLILKTLGSLKMRYMKELVVKYFINNIDKDNCIAFLKLAEELQNKRLQEATIHFIARNFHTMHLADDFNELSYTQLKAILLMVAAFHTKVAFEAILNWIKHEPSTRKFYINELLEFVPIENLPVSYCRNFILNDDFIKNDSNGRKWLVNSFLSFNSPLMRSNQSIYIFSKIIDLCYKFDVCDKLLTELKSRPLFNAYVMTKCRNDVYTFGTRNDMFTAGISCLKYSTIENRWTHLKTLWEGKNEIFACGICTKDDRIYLIGGKAFTQTHNSCVCYDVASDYYAALPNMTVQRCNPGVVSYKSSIYVLGGYPGSTCIVERYDDREGKWFQVGATQPQVTSSAAVVSKYIYCLNRDSGWLFKYDPRYDRSYGSTNIQSYNGGTSLASQDGRLYIGSKDGIAEYDPHASEWNEIFKNSFHHSSKILV